MKIYQAQLLSTSEKNNLFKRNLIDNHQILSIVEDIQKQVEQDGDQALFDLTARFDKVKLASLKVSIAEIEASELKVDENLKKAIRQAKKNIEIFHITNHAEKKLVVETSSGVKCWQEFRAIEKVGLYIPGGTAPLFSTVLMLAVPAKLAACDQIIICSPPQVDGSVAPEILWTAKLCGITEIYKIGGAQAILAMAHGTESIPKVYKIFGPGNQFVTVAKTMVSSRVAIDMPAGPSEVLVIADKNAQASFVAADLLSQAEHGVDSQSVLFCTDEAKSKEILQELQAQQKRLPRQALINSSLNKSFVIICQSITEAMNLSNQYAPEHLILHLDNYQKYLDKIINAGSVFCGPWSPESAGDYASGSNHTLPTSGFAKSFSGVSVESFGKRITFQELSESGLKNLAPTIMTMAEREGLMAHQYATKIRTEK